MLLFSIPTLLQAEEPAAASGMLLWTPGEPLDISAESMRFEADSSRIVFETQVKLTQSGLNLSCHKLTLDSDKNGSLSGFIAEGALQIERAGLKITAMRAEYDHSSRRLTLSGSPAVERNADKVCGERIIIDFASGTVTVEKAQARVNLKNTENKDSANE